MYVSRVHDAVYRITTPYEGGGTVFLYLLRGDQVALVDTGTTGSPAGVIAPALAEIGLTLSDVEVVLTTHGHHDHAGGNLATKRASGAALYLHQADLPLAQSLDMELDYHLGPMRALEFPDDLVQWRTDIVRETAGEEKAEVDALLSGGDRIDLGKGIVLDVLHCPGHTPGSVCFYWGAQGILFTADAIQGLGPKAGAFPYYADAPSYRRSLETLVALDVHLLCLGHAVLGGGVINDPIRRGEECGALLRESIKAADTIHGAVTSALEQRPDASRRELALLALSELIYSIPQVRMRGAEMPLLAARTLLAHMEAASRGLYPI